MNIHGSSGNIKEQNAQAIAVAVFKDEKADSGVLHELDQLLYGVISSALEAEETKGKDGETVFIHLPPTESLKANRLLLVGVGSKEDYKFSKIAAFAGTAVRFLRGKGVKSIAVLPRSDEDAAKVARFAAQGAVFSQFDLDKYRTSDKEERAVDDLTVVIEGADTDSLKSALEQGKNVADSMNFTRDLSNEPPNILFPIEMANRARKMAEEVGLKCEILDEAQMEVLGMGSLLSVSKGSEQPAQLIVLKYEPAGGGNQNKGLLALVGKGITFDTGGISLKPGEGMDAMKYDMTGGGTVLGAMRAIGLLKPSIPVLGVVAAVENMPDGKATRPSDVVTAMNGKTIEILNTDAEGRLILADAVAYAEKQGATHIVDMATLTGAVIIALGDVNTGIMGNDQDWINEIIQCGKDVGEKYWQLPLDEDYSRLIKSDIADIKNIGAGRKAGTIVGAAFIQEFVDKAKWAHLDIAGTAWHDEAKPHRSKGPSAVAIAMLINLVEKRANS
jgi:leucyl aminopeptidase